MGYIESNWNKEMSKKICENCSKFHALYEPPFNGDMGHCTILDTSTWGSDECEVIKRKRELGVSTLCAECEHLLKNVRVLTDKCSLRDIDVSKFGGCTIREDKRKCRKCRNCKFLRKYNNGRNVYLCECNENYVFEVSIHGECIYDMRELGYNMFVQEFEGWENY